MNTVIRPLNGYPAHLVVTFAKASVVLEGAVVDLVHNGWDEDSRRLVHHMARSLRHAAHQARWWDRERALRVIESLLALTVAELLPIRKAVGDKVLEMVAYLMNVPTCRSA
jgi:hypothetical protein